ncbi:helix-turn-helix transcriptional regulator [Streptomyces sp. GZWMJZ-114]|uniref:helix-turn-helix domain-containing protein n=1 Tax=Streptomyces sp. GZWMJZ-114 TaxID=2494734 RepID=UPI001010CA27|nr:helix-turn-helix transcriptional regulator [Streptomyces sp. GZWMJZ-114]
MADRDGPVLLRRRLERLMEVKRDENGDKWNLTSLARHIKTQGGGASRSAISQLFSGESDNPTLNTLEAVCGAFDVRVAYLFEPSDEVAEELLRGRPRGEGGKIADRAGGDGAQAVALRQEEVELLAKIRESDVSEIWMRGIASVSPKGLQTLSDVLDAVMKAEGITDR